MKKNKDFTPDESDLDIPSSLTSKKTLAKVFKAAGKSPNTIPVEILELKSHRQSRAFSIITLIAVMLAAVLVATTVPVVISSFIGSKGRVTTADESKPIYIGDYMSGTDVVIELKKGTNPIDWSGIYAKTTSGDTVSAVSIDESNSTATFPLDQGNLNIYIPDTEGNTLQLILSAQ